MMHRYISMAIIAVLPNVFANPLPYDTETPIVVNAYRTGTDIEAYNQPETALPVNLNTEYFEGDNDPLILAKGLGCAEELDWACCDDSVYDPYYSDDHQMLSRFRIYDCGKGTSRPRRGFPRTKSQSSNKIFEDQPNCPYQLADSRSCCREVEGEHEGQKPVFVSRYANNRPHPLMIAQKDALDRHKLVCAKAE